MFGASIQYDVPGGQQLVVSAAVGEDDNGAQTDTSWVIQGGFNINVADMTAFTAAAVYGEGAITGRCTLNQFNAFAGGTTREVFGAMAGVSVPVSDTTTFNVVWDYLNGDGEARTIPVRWRPVS